MIDFEETYWPPDQCRIEKYTQLEQMFMSQHREAFARQSAKLPDHLKSKQYLQQDYPKFITSTFAGLMFGNPPTFSLPSKQDELKKLVEDNKLATVFFEAEQAASFRGDAVIRLSKGPRYPGGEVEVIIEEVPAYNYFAELDPDNQRRVLSQCLAWERTVGDGERAKRYLRVEHHGAGWIRNELYRFTGFTKLKRVPLSELYGEEAPLEYQDTGVSVPLLFHFPNERHGSCYYGMTDYTPTLVGLFDEANQRLTSISVVLDKHVDPRLILPTGVLDRRGIVKTADLEVIEVAPEDASSNAPRMLTWDAQLESSFKMLDQVDSAILKYASISAAWARQDAGNIDSAPAFNRCFAAMLARVALKQSYREPVIKLLLFTALQLAGAEPEEQPEVLWKNGLPKDDKEMIDAAAVAVAGGFMSKRTAIRYTRQVGDSEAEAELAQIKAEKDAEPPPPAAPQTAPPMGPPSMPMPTETESSGSPLPS